MATAQDVIDRAAALLRMKVPGTAFSTTDSAMNGEGFVVLQNLVSEWGEDGLVDIPAPSATSDTLNVPGGALRALAYNLAMDWGAEVGIDLDPRTLKIAQETRRRISGQVDLDIEADLSDLSFTFGFYNIRTDR